MDRIKTLDPIQLTTDPEKTLAEIENIYQPRFQNVVYCLTGSAQTTEHIIKEIFSQVRTTLSQNTVLHWKQLDFDAWICTLALNITNTWLSMHVNITYDASSLSTLAS